MTPSKAETIDQEVMRLTPEEARQLLALLERHEQDLCEMAKAEEKRRAEALCSVYRQLLGWVRERDDREFGRVDRRVEWVQEEKGTKWTSEIPPDRAVVKPTEDNRYWQVCVYQASTGFANHSTFKELAEAVTWAEDQLLNPREEIAPADDEAEILATAASEPIDLTPFRIDASSLEPDRVTYSIVIQIDSEPESYKVIELSCGEKIRYDEHYLPPSRLARDLHINEAQLPLEQVLGMWNASSIVEAFQQGKVVRARYGIKEVETGDVEWLGACAQPEQGWEKQATREEYLADRAEELTIAHALDVDRFRARLRVKTIEHDDEWVLSALHHRRAKSTAIPEAARRESERWWREHPDAGERAWRHW